MSAADRVAVAMTRQREESQGDMEEWSSAMSYKVYLLERELGYQITQDFPALALVERLKMFDRYLQDQKSQSPSEEDKGKGKSGKGKRLLK